MNAESNLKYLLISLLETLVYFQMSSTIFHELKVPLMFGSENSPDFVKETENLPPDHISPQLKLHDYTALNKGQITRFISPITNFPYF